MARKSVFVFSDDRPSAPAAGIPISVNHRRQPPVSHQLPPLPSSGPQQLYHLFPAAARKAPILKIRPRPPPLWPPTTHVRSVNTNCVPAAVPASEEWSPIDDGIIKLPESMSKSEVEKERIRMNDHIKDVLYGTPDRHHRRLAISEKTTPNYWWGRSPDVMGISQEQHSNYVVLNEPSSEWPPLMREEKKKKKRRN